MKRGRGKGNLVSSSKGTSSNKVQKKTSTSSTHSQVHSLPTSGGDSSTPASGASTAPLPSGASSAAPTTVDIGESDGEESHEPTEEELLDMMKQNERSDIWFHYTKKFVTVNGDRKVKATCNYCKKVFAGDPKNGTTTVTGHIERCPRYKPNIEKLKKGGQLTLEFKDDKLKAVGHTQEEINVACAEMIVIDELPFRHVDGEGFRRFTSKLNPYWNRPCRKTIAKYVWNRFLSEKNHLKNALKGKRVSLTTDTWTSLQNINYMVLTAHFVDDNWKLHKKILNFCVISNHRGDSISKLLEGCMLDWEIEKVLTITVDNASSNDVAMRDLVKRIGNWTAPNALLHDGKHMHMRCVAHILNLIVSDGLTEMNKCIQAVRNVVKYVRSSPQRLDIFKKCVELVKIESKGLVIMDVATRWNSTFLMSQSALKFQKAFNRMEEDDGHFVRYFRTDSGEKIREGPPSYSEWSDAEQFAAFLKPFYEITLHVCCSNSPTVHTTFRDLIKIYGLLKESCGVLLSSISEPMQDKYNKYWDKFENVNPYMFLGVVLDPRRKLKTLVIYFEGLYGELDSRVQDNEKVVRDLLYEMYKVYEEETVATQQMQQTVDSRSFQSSQMEHMDLGGCTDLERKIAEKERKQREQEARTIDNDVDRYLVDRVEGDMKNFDILDWWRVCGTSKYPILAKVAKDVLAIPVSTIASEASFSTSGRVINPFRSSLSPKTVEALICSQNWLTTTQVALNCVPTIQDMEECEAIEEEIFNMTCSSSERRANTINELAS